jgi:hypothetical protein
MQLAGSWPDRQEAEVRSMPTLDEVYRKFGEVAEAAQLLETELGTMLLCVRGVENDLFAGDKGELATEIYNKINKKHAGTGSEAGSQVCRLLGGLGVASCECARRAK